MGYFVIFSILLFAFVGISESAMFPIKVKSGQRAELDLFQGVEFLRREVSTGNQIFHFEGIYKGSFVDGNGKQIKSSNYEIQDVVHKTRNKDGSWSVLPGLSIYYSI
ncbi:hypothetical protein L5515_013852 [Caenorhabditis briggsae]|uniref:Uncharacterized protein n=1 Tax=Caenorhabditis briggsae TaxID=6238 RepID=A0AAE9EAD1_CAEBR|nr:hypothetical protein L5515_013852 [Caenorhabditis briggsae]